MNEAARFLFERSTDVESGAEVILLRRLSLPDDLALEARVAPAAGANLFSLRLGSDELLAQPPSLRDLGAGSWGTPVLFPWPNRLRDAAFSFEGERFQVHPNHGVHAIHGLVGALPFRVSPPEETESRVAVALWLDWDASCAEFSTFPIEHRLTMTYALDVAGLTVAYAVENRSRRRLPFGFGLHPWFQVASAREEIVLRVPAAQRMEADDKFPTGVLLPVEGTPFDLRRGVALAGLDLDDVYFGLTPTDPASFEARQRGLRVILAGTADFAHVVVYTPTDRSVFCIENQTASTDAHNLYDRQLARESGLRVVPPGETVTGAVTWTISRLESAPS